MAISTINSSGLNQAGNTVLCTTSGSVGIGTSSPSQKLTVAGKVALGTDYVATYVVNNGATNTISQIGDNASFGAGTAFVIGSSTAYLGFQTAGTERARIDSSGNLLVGTTSSADATGNTTRFSVVASGGSNDSAINVSGFGDAYGFGIKSRLRSGSSGNAGWHNRFYDSNGAVVGGIYSNGSTTSFSTSSDYRLKHDVQPLQNALARLAALNPVTYKWNADGSDGEGFIAHELAEVAPQCVTGEKDAVDAEGNPQYQGIDTSFLIATLTAAIQELKAIVDAQGAEIAALKGTA